MPVLAEFQQRFAAALLDPKQSLGAAHEAALAVHRNTVIKGLLDVLAANYPTVERLVGADWFRAAADIYVREHLPHRAALAPYGAGFAEFLASFPPAMELPYLSEVARLDRSWTEAHFAADGAVLCAANVQALAPEQLQNLRVRLHPAARCGWFHYSAVTLWICNRPPAVPPDSIEIDGGDEGALFVRPLGEVEMLPIDRDEYLFLANLAAGATLSAAAIAVLEENQAADVSAMLARFLNAGVFENQYREKDNE